MIEAVYDELPGGLCDVHREINFNLCRAVDLTKMSIVMDSMVKEGMDPKLAVIFKVQHEALLAAIRSENNRLKLVKSEANKHLQNKG